MNALEKISTALQASQFAADQAEALAQELHDAVAHELAEKIRISSVEESGSGVRCCGHIVSACADLIDSKKEGQ